MSRSSCSNTIMLRLIVCFFVVVVFSFATMSPLCGQMFNCGCTLFEGMQHCNVHNIEKPHCPWCNYGFFFFAGQLGLVLTGTGFIIWTTLNWIRPVFWLGLLAGLIGYLLLSSLVGLGTVLYVDYPSFYGFRM